MRTIRNWMEMSFMDYRTATELTDAAIKFFKVINPDEAAYERVYQVALTLIKES